MVFGRASELKGYIVGANAQKHATPPPTTQHTFEMDESLSCLILHLRFYDTNRHDRDKIARLLDRVKRIVSTLDPEQKRHNRRVVLKRVRALQRVKKELTKPTRPGGYNTAREALVDFELFLCQVATALAETEYTLRSY